MRDVGPRAPSHDAERLFVLAHYGVLNSEVDPQYEILVEEIQAQCQVPMAAISFVDVDAMRMKASRGFKVNTIPRALCFCSVCIQHSLPMVVEDALLDERFWRNELVLNDPKLRFYAGFPIFSWDGFGLGSVCIADIEPRSLVAREITLLDMARDWVEASLDLKLKMLLFGKRESEDVSEVHASHLSLAEAKEQQAWTAVERLFE